MKLSSVTACDIADAYYPHQMEVMLPYLAQAGFRYVDFQMGRILYPDSPWTAKGDGWKREVERVAKLRDQYGLTFIQSHAPTRDVYVSPEQMEAYTLATCRSIEACHMLGIPQTVVHGLLLWKEKADEDRFIEVNRPFYLPFCEAGERFGVDILMENYGRNMGSFFPVTGKLLSEVKERMDLPRLYFCWDTGHANIGTDETYNQYDDIVAMGSDLHGLHIHDNWGDQDCHAIPFSGVTNFDRVMRALKDIDFKGYFNFEASDLFISSADYRRKRRDLLPGDRLADPSFPLIEKYLELLYETGKWMLEQYGLFEE